MSLVCFSCAASDIFNGNNGIFVLPRHDPLEHSDGRSFLIPWISIIWYVPNPYWTQPFLHLKREFRHHTTLGQDFIHDFHGFDDHQSLTLTLVPDQTKAGLSGPAAKCHPLPKWTFNDITRWSNRRFSWCRSFHCTPQLKLKAETTDFVATAAGAGTTELVLQEAILASFSRTTVRSVFISKFFLKLIGQIEPSKSFDPHLNS